MDPKVITLAIDGDILVYKTALACQEKVLRCTFQDEVTLDFTSLLTLKRHCKKHSINIETVKYFETVALKKNYITSAVFILKKMINNIKINLKNILAEMGYDNVIFKILICLGGKENFRNDIPLFNKYKDRTDEKPLALAEVKKLLSELYTSLFSENEEADDLISMFGFKGRKDMSYITVTEDKDSKQTPLWLFIPRLNKLIFCGGFGQIELITKISANNTKRYKVEGYGRSWLYYQIVCGDPVDTYQPFPTRVTDFQYYKMFKDFTTDQQCWEKIVELYKKYYGHINFYVDWKGNKHKGTWVDILQNYIDVVHMRRFPQDRLIIQNILETYNISCHH